MQTDVVLFMEATGQTVSTVPAYTKDNATQAFLYRELIKEELAELEDAFREQDIVATADALADLLWVIHGLAHTLGINLPAVWHEVSQSNMSKIPPDGTVIRREDGKILKPDSYIPPNISKALGL